MDLSGVFSFSNNVVNPSQPKKVNYKICIELVSVVCNCPEKYQNVVILEIFSRGKQINAKASKLNLRHIYRYLRLKSDCIGISPPPKEKFEIV